MAGKRLSLEEFINKSKLIHLNKYDYSLVEYINSHTKVKIKCLIHGVFEQLPNSHLNGCGCKECAKKTVSEKNSISKKVFIENARRIHGDKYNYNNVIYVNKREKIKIICSIHGEFKQTADSHIYQKSGCPKCGYMIIKLKKHKTLESFISRAIAKHGLIYDYSLVKYTCVEDKVSIICKKHGIFEQKPYKHLQGQGCPLCSESKLEKQIREFLINNKINFISQCSKKNGFDWLGRKSLDFFLTDCKIAIECQGAQHFAPVDFGNKGTEHMNDVYKKIIENDKDKYKVCLENNIDLIYFTDIIICLNKGYWGTIFTDKIEMLDYIKHNFK